MLSLSVHEELVWHLCYKSYSSGYVSVIAVRWSVLGLKIPWVGTILIIFLMRWEFWINFLPWPWLAENFAVNILCWSRLFEINSSSEKRSGRALEWRHPALEMGSRWHPQTVEIPALLHPARWEGLLKPARAQLNTHLPFPSYTFGVWNKTNGVYPL